MSEPAITFENVSKRYRLGALSAGNLRWAIPDPFRALGRRLFGRNGRPARSEADPRELWALKDVSFEVQQGEALGIVGPNGAGKSTILKLVSQITAPTGGRITLQGRVSPLIEVGAGFHPDLTGRENVYLNGAILGMTRREISRKFDSMVAFAELDRFIDTPVKRYSSGMYVRLGFSVAIHLEPEILVVDEILSVGDMRFQRKCINAMQEFRRKAKALLFVSHNMASVAGLCQRCVWLDSGEVRIVGDAPAITSQYIAQSRLEPQTTAGGGSEVWGSGEIRITDVVLRGPDGHANQLQVGDPLRVEITFDARIPAEQAFFWACLVDARGVKIAGSNSTAYPAASLVGPGRGRAVCEFSSLLLAPGQYSVTVGVFDRCGPVPYHRVGAAAYFDLVDPTDSVAIGMLGPQYDGLLSIPSKWCIERVAK